MKKGISVLLVSTLFLTIGFQLSSQTIIYSGSYIIDMGVEPQTVANGLKPYGLVYELIESHYIPVNWVIDETKEKDSADFVYNGTEYKGGPFIVPVEYIDSTVQTVISSWNTQGVQGTYITADISVPVYRTLTTFFPNMVLDTEEGDLVEDYFTNAGIPDSAFRWDYPTGLTDCDDIFILPHADPDWSNHGGIYDFIVNGGYMWAGCHAVSVLESLSDPNPPYEQLNFLTSDGLQCFKANECNAIPEDHAKQPTLPITEDNSYAGEAIMQFMGTMNGATDNGSEKWYLPLTTGGWLNNTIRSVTTSDGSGTSEGSKLAFGYAYGDSSNGMVMYEAGHKFDKGSTEDQVAAQRAFFNFILLSSGNVALNILGDIPGEIIEQADSTLLVTVNGGSGSYNFSWSSSCGGTFSNPNDSVTIFTPDSTIGATTCIITVEVSDGCSRVNFATWIIDILPAPWVLPVSFDRFTLDKTENNLAELHWEAYNFKQSTYFEVQRLNAGLDDFQTIAIVNANHSNSYNNYVFYDDLENVPSGNVYYRIKAVEVENTNRMSEVKSVVNDEFSHMEFTAYPNPLQSSNNLHLNLKLNRPSDISIILYSSSGQMIGVLAEESYDTPVSLSFTPDLDLPSGHYIVSLNVNDSYMYRELVVAP